MRATQAAAVRGAQPAAAAALALLAVACSPDGRVASPPSPAPTDGRAEAPRVEAGSGGTVNVSTTYAVRFASPRRDCAAPVRIAARGEVAWSRDLLLPASGAGPDLLPWNGGLLAASGGAMARFSAEGERLWERAKRAGPVAIANGLAYFESREHFLEAADAANALVLAKAPLPDLADDEFLLTLLWPREKDFVSTVYLPDPKYDSEDLPHEPLQPEVSGCLAAYGSRTGSWGATYRGVQSLPPLFLPESGRWIVALDEVVVVDLATEAESARFRVPLDRTVEWSADADGVLCVSGYTEGRKALVALSSDGHERWRWTDADPGDPWAEGQPPIRAGGGRVYALTESRVLAFESGGLLWTADAVPGTRHRRGTSLLDASLLVTGGASLRHLDATGRTTFAVALDDEILSSPVPDAAGGVYAATSGKLFRIR